MIRFHRIDHFWPHFWVAIRVPPMDRLRLESDHVIILQREHAGYRAIHVVRVVRLDGSSPIILLESL